jgi:hypothetical protein
MAEPEIDRAILALPPLERIKRYGQLADDSLKLAAHTQNPALRREYLAMAAQWRTLEEEAKHAIQATQAPPLKNEGKDQSA